VNQWYFVEKRKPCRGKEEKGKGDCPSSLHTRNENQTPPPNFLFKRKKIPISLFLSPPP